MKVIEKEGKGERLKRNVVYRLDIEMGERGIKYDFEIFSFVGWEMGKLFKVKKIGEEIGWRVKVFILV